MCLGPVSLCMGRGGGVTWVSGVLLRLMGFLGSVTEAPSQKAVDRYNEQRKLHELTLHKTSHKYSLLSAIVVLSTVFVSYHTCSYIV